MAKFGCNDAAWSNNARSGGTTSTGQQTIDRFETQLGQNIQIIRTFPTGNSTPTIGAFAEMKTWIAQGYEVCVSNKGWSYANVISTSLDASIDALFNDWAANADTDPTKHYYYSYWHEPDEEGNAANFRAASERIYSRGRAILGSEWAFGPILQYSTYPWIHNFQSGRGDVSTWIPNNSDYVGIDYYDRGTSTAPWRDPTNSSTGLYKYYSNNYLTELDTTFDYHQTTQGIDRFIFPEVGISWYDPTADALTATKQTDAISKFVDVVAADTRVEACMYYESGYWRSATTNYYNYAMAGGFGTEPTAVNPQSLAEWASMDSGGTPTPTALSGWGILA